MPAVHHEFYTPRTKIQRNSFRKTLCKVTHSFPIVGELDEEHSVLRFPNEICIFSSKQ